MFLYKSVEVLTLAILYRCLITSCGWEKLKIADTDFLTLLKRSRILQHQHLRLAYISLFLFPEAVVRRCSKRLQHRCCPIKFAKFLRTPFFTENLQRLLLYFITRSMYSLTLFLWCSEISNFGQNKKYLLKLIKLSSKVHWKYMSRKCDLNFD